MNCPYCNKEMEKGEVQVGHDGILGFLLSGGPIVWVPENESKKIIPKEVVHLNRIAEGYYCDKCVKTVAIFEEQDEDFFNKELI